MHKRKGKSSSRSDSEEGTAINEDNDDGGQDKEANNKPAGDDSFSMKNMWGNLLTCVDIDSDRDIFCKSLVSRILILCGCVVADALIPDHRATDVQHFDSNVSWWLKAFTKWDSAHFLTIAKDGYTHDKSTAFMPFFPLCIRMGKTLLEFLVIPTTYCKDDDLYILSALIINSLAFAMTSVILKHLSTKWGYDQDRRLRNIFFLHICNPANIFFTTCYSESLFSLFSWTGMLLNTYDVSIWSVIPYTIASSVRSNGILNATLMFMKLLHVVMVYLQPSITTDQDIDSKVVQRKSRSNIKRLSSIIISNVIALAIMMPSVIIDLINISRFCNANNDAIGRYNSHCRSVATENSIIIFDIISVSDYFQYIHINDGQSYYGYIQSKYWDVGFLKYYVIKQLPNFLLTIPMLVVLSWLNAEWKRVLSESSNKKMYQELKHLLFHLAFHVIIIYLLANVQILSRVLLSSCPFVFVAMSILMEDNEMVMLFYLIIFNCLGIILHANFYPWT